MFRLSAEHVHLNLTKYTMASGNIPTSASGPRDTADPADTLVSMEARLARLRARLDELDADAERQRREKKELDIEIAIRKGTLELLGKEPGADPENLTNREKTILVKQISEAQSVSVKSLLPVVGLAHSTYHYRLNAMRRPDRDAWLLPLVEGRSRTARSATATSACTWNCRAWG